MPRQNIGIFEVILFCMTMISLVPCITFGYIVEIEKLIFYPCNYPVFTLILTLIMRSYTNTKMESIKKKGGINPVRSREFLQKAKKHAGGRPPKYSEARRPITVTLPERILHDLQSINHDRSRAIVKCIETAMAKDDRFFKLVELIEVSSGKALILVGPSSSLKQIEWLRLVEIAPLRYLLVLPSGTPIEVLEVTIQDMLANLEPDNSESILLTELLNVIRHQRKNKSISKAELLFVDIPLIVNSRKS